MKSRARGFESHPLRRARTVWVAAIAASLLPAASPSAAQSEAPLDFYAAAPDLRAYVTQALERNPALLESRARYQAALRKAPQARALPDPVVTFTQALRSIETRVGPQRNSLTLSQAFPWFGTLDRRGQVAALEATALRHRHEAARRDLVARVKEAYYNLGYLDAALDLAAEGQSLVEHYETLARARYATGQGLQQEVIRLQAEISRILDHRRLLEGQRASLAARLNTMLDRPADEPVPKTLPLLRPDVAVDREDLQRLGEQRRHELMAAAALIEGSEQALELARMESRPDFVASVGVTRIGERDASPGVLLPPDNGRNALTVSVGATLPLWSERYRAGIEEANDELRARGWRREAVRNAMEGDIADAIVRLETLDRQIDLLDTVLIPQTGEALRATETAYETGQLGVLDLLDSERTLIDVRTLRARYLSDLLIALSALERAVGAPVPLKEETP